MTDHLLVLGVSQDDALDYTLRSKTIIQKRREGATVTLVWPGAWQRIAHLKFDDLHVTSAVITHEVTGRRDHWVAACRTRVRGPDGLIASERIKEVK